MASLFYSNRIEKLFDHLKKDLYAQPRPFLKRMVVVPSPLMKAWLNFRLVNESESKVSMGLKYCYLNEVIHELYNQWSHEQKRVHIPSQLELSLAIEKKVEQCFENEEAMWVPLKTYLGNLRTHKGRVRLVRLAEHLSVLFHQYGIYGGRMVTEWERGTCESWQQQLWKEIYTKENHWTYPAKGLAQGLTPCSEESLEVFVFGLSFIPPIHYQFMQHFSNVHYYTLSPCSVFWSDTCSDRELISIQKQWEAQGISISQQEAAEEYLMDRNTILANNGKLGRKQALNFEKSEITIHAEYEISAEVLNESIYRNLVNSESVFVNDAPKTLLQCVQADLVLLRPQTEKIALEYDDSISFHQSTSLIREIENLYDTIMRCIYNSKGTICPKDVIVMAPDISKYEPYIKSVFGNVNSQLDFQIYDLKISTESVLSQGFMYLITLAESRWEATAVIKLFENQHFQHACSLSKDDVNIIKKWMAEAKFHWGYNEKHKHEVLKREYVNTHNMSSKGTWESGLSKLLLGSIYSNIEDWDFDFDQEIPLEGIESSNLNLLSKFLKIIHSLKQDLDVLNEKTSLTLNEWVLYLNHLLEVYFKTNPEDENEKIAIQKEIASLASSQSIFKSAQFSWKSIEERLAKIMNTKSLTFHENHLQAVCFCSMLPLRAIPAKIIALMGVQEGIFPKKQTHDSLNLLNYSSLSDYSPTNTDYDRYLFLEAILSARDHLVLSYCNDENEDLAPSLLINEFKEYLQSQYSFQFEKCFWKHFYKGYDVNMFKENERSFSKFQFNLAKCNQIDVEKHLYKKASGLIQKPKMDDTQTIYIVDAKDLLKLSKNPLRLFCHKSLEVYLDEKESLSNETPLSLDFLQKYQLRKKGLELGLDKVFAYEYKNGSMPSGLFHVVAEKQIANEVNEISEYLEENQISYKDLKTVMLDPHCDFMDNSEGNLFKIPSIEISLDDGKLCRIVGEITQVSPKGIVSLSKYDRKEKYKLWGHLVILNHLKDICEPNILFPKSCKNMSFPDNLNLKKFLEYYFRALENPSPLLPEYLPDILEGRFSKIGKSFDQYRDPYIDWFQINDWNEEYFEYWRNVAEDIFSEQLDEVYT